MRIFNRRVVAAAIGGLAIAMAALFASNHYWGGPPPTEQTLAPCPAFSRNEQSCTFGAAIAWVKTGTQPNLQPCIIPMPSHGSYVLWQGDGVLPPSVWRRTTPLPVVNLYGFQSAHGTRTVRYRLVEFADHCGTYF